MVIENVGLKQQDGVQSIQFDSNNTFIFQLHWESTPKLSLQAIIASLAFQPHAKLVSLSFKYFFI